ncbi:hypothetical protein KAI46_04740 [bacterium]|nr:hypothetical protein [bacterium]
MNFLFYFFILISFLVAGWRQINWVPVEGLQEPLTALTATIITTAGDAVELAIGLIGVMALFLGLLKVAEEGGLLRVAARGIRPLLIRLFPEVPAEHPAMGAMVMNLSANLLGLGNATTPFGIKAMQELETLNYKRNYYARLVLEIHVIGLRNSLPGFHHPGPETATTTSGLGSRCFFAAFFGYQYPYLAAGKPNHGHKNLMVPENPGLGDGPNRAHHELVPAAPAQQKLTE